MSWKLVLGFETEEVVVGEFDSILKFRAALQAYNLEQFLDDTLKTYRFDFIPTFYAYFDQIPSPNKLDLEYVDDVWEIVKAWEERERERQGKKSQSPMTVMFTPKRVEF